ncbi:hypothetical protein JQ628_22655 [Bradyrhizobium lablabi]|uniref:hypothetical protein n=1 Tax=Bradyrhizobium lablabi TaxID=722472 RepID=UPI001BADF357|nr:hypothetical protein [Bradyrhizobium lablabi]MBR1124347.1 hypothetical protein [Bradyrhizobium lablabi]
MTSTAILARFASSVRTTIGKALWVSAILSVATVSASLAMGMIEVESNIGSTVIDDVILREGYNPKTLPPGESSPLSVGIRAHLVERTRQGGAAAVEAALLEAGASCRASTSETRHCEIARYRVLRSADLIGARYERADWIVSISYVRRGNDIRNIHVTYTITGKLINR